MINERGLCVVAAAAYSVACCRIMGRVELENGVGGSVDCTAALELIGGILVGVFTRVVGFETLGRRLLE